MEAKYFLLNANDVSRISKALSVTTRSNVVMNFDDVLNTKNTSEEFVEKICEQEGMEVLFINDAPTVQCKFYPESQVKFALDENKKLKGVYVIDK